MKLPHMLWMSVILLGTFHSDPVRAQSRSNPWAEGGGYCPSTPQINSVCAEALNADSAALFCQAECDRKARAAPNSANPQCATDCKTAVLAERNQVLERCLAIEYNAYGEDYQGVAFGLHTIAAVACTAACAGQWIDLLVGKAIELTCEISAVVAGSWDMGSSLYLQNKYSQDIEWLSVGMSGIGTVPAIAGLVSGSRGGKPAVKLTDKLSACIPAAISVGMAYSKYQDWDSNGQRVKAECQKAEQTLSSLSSSAVQSLGGAPQPSEANPTLQFTASTGIGKVAADKASDGTGNQKTDAVKEAFRSPQALAQKLGALAAKDPSGNLRAKAPKTEDLSKLFEALSRAGLDPAALVEASRGAGSASAALSAGLSQLGLKPELDAAARKFAGNIEKGQPTLTARYGAPGTGGGLKSADKSGAGKTDPFAGLFGQNGGLSGGGAAPGTLAFDAVVAPVPRPLSDDESIFHVGFTGSLFDIVSGKLSQSLSRVEELEWDTRMNRALTGLPPKDASLPARKVERR